MGGSTIVVWWGLGLALLVLTVLTVIGAAAGRLGVSVASVVAVGRAIVQLAVVSSVIVAVGARGRHGDRRGTTHRHRGGSGGRDRHRWSDDGDVACGTAGARSAKRPSWGVEAALSLGFVDRDAAIEVIRPSARDALVPALDQTRTVGLVTLPGAFVGVLLGSGDPVQAGAAQVLVLVGLLAAETIAVLVTIELIARGGMRRADRSEPVRPGRTRKFVGR
jgi:putative ABC transport system permease protein